MAVTYALTRTNHDSPLLDRLRNEIASEISGVAARDANTRGLELMQGLVLIAPRSDGEVVFIPPQRAVSLLQRIQKWIGGDEDLDDELLNLITVIFYHLAPIVQSVQGTHWDLIFDVLEQNLEVSWRKQRELVG
jgi:E3 ubiquitin-protein ligase listerin